MSWPCTRTAFANGDKNPIVFMSTSSLQDSSLDTLSPAVIDPHSCPCDHFLAGGGFESWGDQMAAEQSWGWKLRLIEGTAPSSWPQHPHSYTNGQS